MVSKDREKVEYRPICPECGGKCNYNPTNIGRYTTKDGNYVKCKNRKCKHLYPLKKIESEFNIINVFNAL